MFMKQSQPKARNTKTRRLVIELMKSHREPRTLRQLYVDLCPLAPKAAFSTIFRIIRSLEAEGSVVRFDWRERGSRYEWAEDPHHHLVCRLCGAVRDLHDDELAFDQSRIEHLTGFQIKHHSIELEGICQSCQTKINRS